MRFAKWTTLALAAPLLLAGCKGFWDEPASTTTGTTTDTSGNIYILNAETNQIAGYYVNAGTLTALSGSPYTPPEPLSQYSSITIAPNNNFLYVSTVGGVYLYTIASNGALTLANSSGPITSNDVVSMQVSANNSWLVEIASQLGYVYAVPINSSTGVATSSTLQYATLPATTMEQMAIAPDDSYVFVAMGTGGTAIVPFNVGNTNPFGAVGTIGVKLSGSGALSVAVDPSERLFYVGETNAVSGLNTGGVRVFDFSTQTEVSGSPYASGGIAPYSILPKSSGDYVYVVNRQTDSGSTGVITAYTIATTSSSYSLSALSTTYSTGTNPVAMVEDKSGQFLFAVNFGGSPDLKGYTFDTTTAGALDAVISSSTGTDPVEATAIAATH